MIYSPESLSRSLRIAVADDEGFMRKYLQTVLPRLGHQVVGTAQSGRELIDLCAQVHPDLVITDINMPELDGLEAAAAIYESQPVPIIVISGYHTPEVIERTLAAHVMAYLVKPIRQSDLEPAIALAVRRFEQLQTLENETVSLRDNLQQQTVVEQAMHVLMKWAKQCDDASLKRLQQMAADKQFTLTQVAELILRVDRDPSNAQDPTDAPRPAPQ